jgi:hypothetical protein
MHLPFQLTEQPLLTAEDNILLGLVPLYVTILPMSAITFTIDDLLSEARMHMVPSHLCLTRTQDI